MIPLSEPYLAGNEWTYIKECLDTNWVSSAGSFVNKFEDSIASYTRSPYAIATNSGTSALQLALKVAGVQAGDIVLMPNLTFVATANVVNYLGAAPVFIDVTESYWQMDTDLLENFLENRCQLNGEELIDIKTKRRIGAIISVHILGYMGNVKKLATLANKWRLPLIEDSTESLGSTFEGIHAGTIGNIGCLSFNGNKIITTGGGGMLLTSNKEWAEKAKHLSIQAKVRGLDYYHDEVGYNFRLVNLLAAMGLGQLENFSDILLRKKQIAHFYHQELSEVIFPQIYQGVSPNFWLNTFITKDKQALINYLSANGIQSRPLWVPMNQLPMYASYDYYAPNNISKYLYDHCVSIPSSSNLAQNDQEKVIEAIQKFTKRSRYS